MTNEHGFKLLAPKMKQLKLKLFIIVGNPFHNVDIQFVGIHLITRRKRDVNDLRNHKDIQYSFMNIQECYIVHYIWSHNIHKLHIQNFPKKKPIIELSWGTLQPLAPPFCLNI